MNYVEAPNNYDGLERPAVFLAGGISGCPDWQESVRKLLFGPDLDLPGTLINPRRANFPMGDPLAGVRQIEWEYQHLRSADAIMFWFPAETLCPIALYELGFWAGTDTPLFVGTHPDYQRAFDVAVQTRLVRPGLHVWNRLELVTAELARWIKQNG